MENDISYEPGEHEAEESSIDAATADAVSPPPSSMDNLYALSVLITIAAVFSFLKRLDVGLPASVKKFLRTEDAPKAEEPKVEDEEPEAAKPVKKAKKKVAKKKQAKK